MRPCLPSWPGFVRANSPIETTSEHLTLVTQNTEPVAGQRPETPTNASTVPSERVLETPQRSPHSVAQGSVRRARL